MTQRLTVNMTFVDSSPIPWEIIFISLIRRKYAIYRIRTEGEENIQSTLGHPAMRKKYPHTFLIILDQLNKELDVNYIFLWKPYITYIFYNLFKKIFLSYTKNLFSVSFPVTRLCHWATTDLKFYSNSNNLLCVSFLCKIYTQKCKLYL